MNWFSASLTLAGPTGTPWQADTIFGHLCWALRHREGEASLREFLAPFIAGQPPLLLSSGFPPGLLPRPLVPLPTPEDTPPQEAFQRGRALRKQEYLTTQDFERALHRGAFWPQPVQDPHHTRVTLKNQVSRLTGTTPERGGLFGFVEHWTPQVVIYLKVAPGYEQQAKELVNALAQAGYGKRKSVGYGAIRRVEFSPFQGFGSPYDANAFVSLSPFVPAASDPAQGFWRTRVKYGKLGEEWASAPNPFKRPVLMFTEGSVLYDNAPREWYGRMVLNVSEAHPDVVHYGYALPVPMRLGTPVGG